MAMNFSDLSGLKQWGAVIAGGAIVTAALFFTVFKTQSDKNAAAQHTLQDKVRENNELESYRPKLKDMERQLANLKQQLEIEARIVPDDKQVDSFMETLDGEAAKAGVELRRYTAKPVAAKEYYSELPFDLELDGPYYSMLNFFDRVGKLERIVNVSGLLVSNTRNPTFAKATTFFSHDLEPAAAAPGSKPATTAAGASK